jgi:hypothetical protein
MTNTALEYMYRDASNYKTGERVIFAGAITDEQRATIAAGLKDGSYLIAEQVDLSNLRETWETHFEDDHVWHELDMDDISLTEEDPTEHQTIADFAARFEGIAWDVNAAVARLDEWKNETPYGH